MPRFNGNDKDAEDDWDKAFEEELFCGDNHKWDFPVAMGDWCKCGEARWLR